VYSDLYDRMEKRPMIPWVRKVYEAAQWWTGPPMPGATEVVDALASWASSVVPEGCAVAAGGAGITITCGTAGYQATIPITPALRDVGPREEVLARALRMFAVAFQRSMCRITDRAWPDEDAGALPHCTVTSDSLHVWWGGPTRQDALVEVPPIRRLDSG
jgi:hypothetical protein